MNGDGYVHGNCAFTIDCLAFEVATLDERVNDAIALLLEPDDGYGLSADGVVRLINCLRGEPDGFGTPGQLA